MSIYKIHNGAVLSDDIEVGCDGGHCDDPDTTCGAGDDADRLSTDDADTLTGAVGVTFWRHLGPNH